MTSGRSIDYEALAQEAMRGVVRQVLTRTAKSGGLPGDHHFYISFDTQNPGVNLSKRLREKYPEEMTIVLQHRFWDLTVTDDRFEVKLTFDGIPERLVIPFNALRVFFDPSVRYGLQFEDAEARSEGAPSRSPGLATGRPFGAAVSDERGAGAPGRAMQQRKRPQRKQRLDQSDVSERGATQTSESSGPGPEKASEAAPPAQPASVPALTPVPARPDLKSVPTTPSGAQIVSLSDFRKK